MKIPKITSLMALQKLILVLLLIIGLPALKFMPSDGYAQVAQPHQFPPLVVLRAIIIVTGLLRP